MAKLINGNGNPAVYAAQDADLIASICGDTTCIAAVGSEYAATQEDANTVGLADGVIITKEGRRIQLDAGYTDLFTIPTGTAGTTSYYIIGYKLKTESDSRQTCETFVQKMNSSSATIPEDTFRGGASEVYVSVYRVTQNGLNIQTITKLLPTLSIGATASSHTGTGSTVTNTIAAGKNLDEVAQTLLNNDHKINSDLIKTKTASVNSSGVVTFSFTTLPSIIFISVATSTSSKLYALIGTLHISNGSLGANDRVAGIEIDGTNTVSYSIMPTISGNSLPFNVGTPNLNGRDITVQYI